MGERREPSRREEGWASPLLLILLALWIMSWIPAPLITDSRR
jgi:hypothetical protein